MTTELDPTQLDYVMRQLVIIRDFNKNELPDIMEKVAIELEKRVGIYAPERSGQKYVRTNTYKDSVFKETKAIRNGHQAIAGSHGATQRGNRYDPYLKDERKQASIHKGRWTTLSDDADNTLPYLEELLQDAVGDMKI